MGDEFIHLPISFFILLFYHVCIFMRIYTKMNIYAINAYLRIDAGKMKTHTTMVNWIYCNLHNIVILFK